MRINLISNSNFQSNDVEFRMGKIGILTLEYLSKLRLKLTCTANSKAFTLSWHWEAVYWIETDVRLSVQCHICI
jgi:hypothetical protein